MARIQHVKKARKDQGYCRRCGTPIKKGDSYKWFKNRYAPKKCYCHLHNPRPSEMTTSDKLSRILEAQEQAQDAIDMLNSAKYSTVEEAINSISDQLAELEEAVDNAREVGEEYQESADNLDYASPGHYLVDEINEKGYACESWADEIDTALYNLKEVLDTLENVYAENEDAPFSSVPQEQLSNAISEIEGVVDLEMP